jgi:Ti-type conjugative transfer relaxase TraA
MAIAFARARYLSRAAGGNAVRSAAYNKRDAIQAERTGEVFYFKNRDAPEHHAVLLPKGAAARFADAGVLWNAAEGAEKRRDAQVAREIVLALPANRELGHDDRVALARSFAEAHFVAKGLAVQLDVHAPHAGDGESERANHHAHLLITTRRLEGEGFARTKARDLDPEIRRMKGRAVVAEGEAWGATWREHQNRYFMQAGLGIRVDPVATVAQAHIGPIRMRTAEAKANARLAEVARANAAAALDPEAVLETLTRHAATFSVQDLERYLTKHLGDDAAACAHVKAAVLGHADVLALYDPESGADAGRYTTHAVRAEEREVLAAAADVAMGRRWRQGVSARTAGAVVEAWSLRADQRAAFDHAVAAGGLKVIEGRAGTGKSHTLQAVREAHARHRVIGLAPTNTVAQDLKREGFAEAATVHGALFALKNGRDHWDNHTVLIVDEAAMLGTRVTGALLAEAACAGAKVILAGDDKQLASIARGGLFAEIKARHGAAEITQVTRQRQDWQRAAAEDLAAGRFQEAVAAFDRHGAITWVATRDEARAALVARWTEETAARPEASNFVFAYTNRDVDALNADLRQARRDQGKLGADHAFATAHGELLFAVGDRVQFTETRKTSRIYNGNVGTITGIDGLTGRITATIDGDQRAVSWTAGALSGFRHGYAGTIYKGQGKTLERTYLYHTHHWRSAPAYVALTRQRDWAQVFVAKETAKDVRALARQMARAEVKAASVAFATADELPEALRAKAEPRVDDGSTADAKSAETARRSSGQASVTAPEPSASAPEGGAGEGVWIPAFVDRHGRDSLGRRLDAASVAAAVGRDGRVADEQAAVTAYIAAAFRDAPAARERLDKLIARDGLTSTALRIAAEPTVLGELQGRDGLLAGRAARAERERALKVTAALVASLNRLGERQAEAGKAYVASVEAQRAADATPIPKLSDKAEAAVAAITAAGSSEERAKVWRAAQADENVAGELKRFSAAVRQRFGADGVRTMLRAAHAGQAVAHASVPDVYRDALRQVARAMRAVTAGEQVQARETQKLAEAQRLSQGRQLKM